MVTSTERSCRMELVAMVVLGGMGNIWGVILGAVLLSFVPEILRFTVEPVLCTGQPRLEACGDGWGLRLADGGALPPALMPPEGAPSGR